MNFFIIVSVSVYHSTYGQNLFFDIRDSSDAQLKAIYDEEIILEWYLVVNAVLAFLLAIVNFSVFIRRESIGDELPQFFVADITGQVEKKNLTLNQVEANLAA